MRSVPQGSQIASPTTGSQKRRAAAEVTSTQLHSFRSKFLPNTRNASEPGILQQSSQFHVVYSRLRLEQPLMCGEEALLMSSAFGAAYRVSGHRNRDQVSADEPDG